MPAGNAGGPIQRRIQVCNFLNILMGTARPILSKL